MRCRRPQLQRPAQILRRCAAGSTCNVELASQLELDRGIRDGFARSDTINGWLVRLRKPLQLTGKRLAETVQPLTMPEITFRQCLPVPTTAPTTDDPAIPLAPSTQQQADAHGFERAYPQPDGTTPPPVPRTSRRRSPSSRGAGGSTGASSRSSTPSACAPRSTSTRSRRTSRTSRGPTSPRTTCTGSPTWTRATSSASCR